MASLFSAPQFDGGHGITPEDGLQLFFFEEGTLTPKGTFTDEALTIPSAHPVVSDGSGVFEDIWMTEGDIYKARLWDKNDVLKGFGVVEVYISGLSTGQGVADLLNGLMVGIVDNVAVLIASPVSIGDQVSTRGRIAVNDGGADLYNIVASGAGIALNNGLIAAPISTLGDNPLQSGMIGGGVTDSFAIITQMITDGLERIFIYDNFLIDSSIDLKGIEVIFSGNGAVTASTGVTIDIDNFSAPKIEVFKGDGDFTFTESTSVIFPEYFGATTADSDQSVNIQRGIDAASQAKAEYNGSKQEYRVDQVVTHKANVRLKDIKFNASNGTVGDIIDTTEGYLDSPIVVSVDIALDDTQIQIASTATLTAGDYLKVSSDAFWSTLASVPLSEIVRVASVDTATAVTLFGKIELAFTTADNAKIEKYNLVQGVESVNVSIRSDNTLSQNGANYKFCENLLVENFQGNKILNRHVLFNNCIYPRYINGIANEAGATGTGYGLIMAACLGVYVSGITGSDIRHLVTFGGTSGISQGGTISGVFGTAMRASIIDTHAAARGQVWSNTSSISPNMDANEDGITMQGINQTINNLVMSGGASRHGALIQPQVSFTGLKSAFFDINMNTEDDEQFGFIMDTSGVTDIDFIKANITTKSTGRSGIQIKASNANIQWVDVTANITGIDSTVSECIRLQSSDPSNIGGGTINVRSERLNDSDNNILLQGTAANNIKDIVVTGVLKRGNFGIVGSSVDTGTVNFTGVVFRDMSTANTTGL